MEARHRTPLLVVPLALFLAASGFAAAELPNPYPDDGFAPWLGDVYQHLLKDALNDDVSDGLDGVISGLLHRAPSTDQVWDLVRFVQDTAQDPPSPGAPDTGLPEGTAVIGTSDPEPTEDTLQKVEQAAEPLDQVVQDVNRIADDLPTQPATDPLEDLVHSLSELGSDPLHLPDLDGAPSQDGDAAAPSPLAAAEGQGDAGVPAPPETDGRVLPAGDALVRTSNPLRETPLPGAEGAAAGDDGLVPRLDDPQLWLGNPFAEGALAMLGAVVLLVPPLYHRLQRHRLLDHPARAALHAAIVQRPGAHIEELARVAGVARSTAVYHLKLLARHGLVLTLESRKAVHYYPNNGQAQEHERPRMALLASPRTRAVASGVAAGPGRDRAAVAVELGISPSTLSWHLGKLLEQGLVMERRPGAGGAAVLDPAPDLVRLLRAWTPATVEEQVEEPEAPTMILA